MQKYESLLQQYDKSRTLLLAADGVIHPISYPISRMIRGEVLYVDLLQYYNTTGNVAQDLSKRVKICVNSLNVDKGKQIIPVSTSRLNITVQYKIY